MGQFAYLKDGRECFQWCARERESHKASPGSKIQALPQQNAFGPLSLPEVSLKLRKRSTMLIRLNDIAALRCSSAYSAPAKRQSALIRSRLGITDSAVQLQLHWVLQQMQQMAGGIIDWSIA